MKREQTQNQIVQERSKEKSVSEKTEKADECTKVGVLRGMMYSWNRCISQARAVIIGR